MSQPQSAEALIAIGSSHAGRGDAAAAISAFQAALNAQPEPGETAMALNSIARCYAHIGRLNEAVDFATQSMLAAASTSATTYLATLLYQTGRQGEAAKIFARPGVQENASATLLMCFGQLFIQLEQRENAIAAYDLGAERRPLKIVDNEAVPADWAISSPYSAQNPSPRYAELIEQYQTLHRQAQSKLKGQGQMFEGIVGFAIVAPYVRRFRQKVGAKTMLDYGGGRGAQYKLSEIRLGSEKFSSSMAYLGLQSAVCFDPGFDSSAPSAQYDLVICVDALEHCDRQDLPWIIRTLFQKARLGVFANIASYLANKNLPNGENAHCTVEDAAWWMGLFRAVADDFPTVPYEVIVSKDLQQADRVVFGRRP